ncbi:MAG: phosphate/phosphite/phosphonate ABC transporter substrate-binding protein [Chloroflexi bacterium HGW-Chloroflexi-1]|nr:MAG: phosphate/phosphite/phosphonate ABC transporter substrate-binding protein [Chloroflexi bacterium HGW-Chloroflexi-1]
MNRYQHLFARFLLFCVCLVVTVACTVQVLPADRASVRLDDLRPLPAAPQAAVVPLHVAVAAVISPRGNLESYSPLLAYLGRKLGRPVEMVQRRTYAEINDLVRDGQVAVAFVCTSAYIAGRRDFGMQLLAAPQVDGATVYYSYLIVPANSPARSMADLQGKVFAFTDPMSFSGRVYPTSLVRALGAEPETFFSRTFFTYSHDNALRAVADGLADGAGVDSLVYDFAVAREPALASKVKVIHRSPPFGIPPVVVGPDVRPQLRAELYDLLLGLQDDPEGPAILAALGFDRFVPIEDAAYDSVRQLTDGDGMTR